MTDEAEIQKRRIYVGGLFPSITANDITDKFSKFGNVSNVQIKVRKTDCGTPDKTFAYVDFLSTKGNWQKCLSTFNHTKWKGSELKLELAKTNFLEKLEEERRAKKEETPQQNSNKCHLHNPLQNLEKPDCFELRGAVPGTPIPGEDWVVGKYGRILPILHMKKDGKQKLITTDPSKYCHNLKKLKDDDTNNLSPADLTWEITHSDSAVTKKRKGEFESWTPRQKQHTDQNYFMLKKFYDKRLKQSRNGVTDASDSDDFEVVKTSTQLSDGEDSAGSADTDEIIANIKSVNKQSHMDSRRHSQQHSAGLINTDSTTDKSNKPSSHNSIVKMSDSLSLRHKNDSNKSSSHNSVVKMSDSLSLRRKNDSPSGKLSVQNSSIKTSDLSLKKRYNSDSCSLSSESETEDSDTVTSKDSMNRGTVLKRKSSLTSSTARVNKLNSAAKQIKYSKACNTEHKKYFHSSSNSSSSPDSCDVTDLRDKHSSQPSLSFNWNTSQVPEFKGLSMLSSDSEENDISTKNIRKSNDNSLRKVNKNVCKKSDVSGVGNSIKQINKNVSEESDLSDSDSVSSTNTDEIISNAKKNFNKNETLNPMDEYVTGFSIISGDVSRTQRKPLTDDDDDDDFVKLDELTASIDKKMMSSTPKPVAMVKNKSHGLSPGASCAELPNGDKMSSKTLKTADISTLSQDLEKERKLLKDSDRSQKKVNDSPSSWIKSSKMSDKKHAEDNQKRLQSVMERQRENLMQKAILKKALSSVDGSSSSNKKIVFDSDDDFDSPSTAEPSLADSKTNHSNKQQMMNTGPSLFDSADENDDYVDVAGDMFRLRKQYEGKSGRKLMSLQARIGSDERFRLDERFADSEEDKKTDVLGEDEKAEESEKARSLKILESVVGRDKLANLNKQDSKKKKFKDIAAVRFDPSREDHSQFEVKRADTEIQKNVIKPEKSKKKVKKTEDDVVEEDLPEVDETRHFEVSATLKDAFKKSDSQSKASFSLLSAFGVHNRESQASDGEDTPVKTSLSRLPWKTDNNSEDELMSASDVDQDGPDTSTSDSKPAPLRVIFPVQKRTFFFTADDERLKEGVKYFQRPPNYESVVRTWREKRLELIDAYKIKHKRAVKRLQSKQTQYRK